MATRKTPAKKTAQKTTKKTTKKKKKSVFNQDGITCKRGIRSKKETEALYQYISDGKSVEEIATLLNRNVPTVRKWLDDLHIELIGADPLDVKRILDNLHKMHFWPDVCQQFSADEIKYFEGEWLALMTQFREDVKSAECLTLKQLITVNILINRSMKERKTCIDRVDELQGDILRERQSPAPDEDRIFSLEQALTFTRQAIAQFTGEYTKLLGEQKHINKELKATRSERIQRIEDAKTSFTGWLRALEDETHRERVGYDAEINKIAKDKAKGKLYQYNTYDDDEVDRPILNNESVLLDES